MFAATITVTIDSVAKVLNRISDGNYSSEYLLRETTSEFRMKIRHSSYIRKKTGRPVHRHACELTQLVFGTDTDAEIERKFYFVMENDHADPSTDTLNFGVGMVGFATSGNLTKLIGWES